jgi:hypothetical protein
MAFVTSPRGARCGTIVGQRRVSPRVGQHDLVDVGVQDEVVVFQQAAAEGVDEPPPRWLVGWRAR